MNARCKFVFIDRFGDSSQPEREKLQYVMVNYSGRQAHAIKEKQQIYMINGDTF